MNITNEKVIEYLHEFYVPLTPELGKLRAYGEANHIPVILKETERFLASLVQLKTPGRILEIGTAIGYSAAVLAELCPESQIITIERNPELYDAAVNNMESLGYKERVRVLFGDASEQLEMLESRINREETGRFDLVFIDAGKSHYQVFWDKALPLCGKGTVILCDNVLMDGTTVIYGDEPPRKHRTNIKNMRKFLSVINSAPQVHTSILPVGDGIALSILK